jgi:hypothetical protein
VRPPEGFEGWAGGGNQERDEVGDHQQEDEQGDDAGFGRDFAEPDGADKKTADE